MIARRLANTSFLASSRLAAQSLKNPRVSRFVCFAINCPVGALWPQDHVVIFDTPHSGGLVPDIALDFDFAAVRGPELHLLVGCRGVSN